MQFLKTLFESPKYRDLVEGQYADQYPEHDGPSTRSYIREQYRQRWRDPDLTATPYSHPWLFDPCTPPQGWRYDPYYEIWQKDYQ